MNQNPWQLSSEYATGVADILGQVVGTLFRQALAGDTTVLIFIAKTRLGWSEKTRVEISSPSDDPNRVIYSGTDEAGRMVIVQAGGEVITVDISDREPSVRQLTLAGGNNNGRHL